MKFWIILIATAVCLSAATIQLYLKDGSFQKVKEYQVVGDRVKYLSAERGEWEEIPKDLIDLEKTEGIVKAAQQADAENTKADLDEKKAESDARREIRSLPAEPGVYYVDPTGKIVPLKLAESKMVTNKRRSLLAALSPIPVFAGKATVEIDGTSSNFAISEDRPNFYFRLAKEERMELVRLKPNTKKVGRVVQSLDIVPVVKEILTTMDIVETFRRQVGEGLYKVWPTESAEAGEYALVEYTEGKTSPLIYDFSRK